MNQIINDGTVTTLFVSNFRESFRSVYGCSTSISSLREATSLRFNAILISCWWIGALTLIGLILVCGGYLSQIGIVGVTLKISMCAVIFMLGAIYTRSAYKQIMQKVPYVAALIFISGHESLFLALENLGINIREAESADIAAVFEMICPKEEGVIDRKKVWYRNIVMRYLGQEVHDDATVIVCDDGMSEANT